jgi:hypothetical protein
MTDEKPGKKPQEPVAPPKRLTPKRGLFPTPKQEVEKATPYVPEAGEADEEATPASPPEEDEKEDEKKKG